MNILRVDPRSPDPAAIAAAAATLRAGGLVAFPTETVYGLGANALDAAAIARIYRAKGRPAYNPLIVHVADVTAARALASEWSDAADLLARAFWPGPLTLVVPRIFGLPDAVTAGLGTVGLRVPRHPVAEALLRAAEVPVAAPSANRSFALSPTSAAHVAASLGDAVDVLLDGGPTDVGIESTVVSVAGPVPVLLRPGMITLAALKRVVPAIELRSPTSAQPSAPASPGMLDRHYAPRAQLRLYGSDERDAVAAEISDAMRRGATVGVVSIGDAPAAADVVRRMPPDAAAYARALFAVLHAMDDAGCALIFAERVPNGEAWAGVRDRLERAARSA